MTKGRLKLWPRSLATRTALVLLAGLMLVQIAGLTIHALDRIDIQQIAQLREVSGQISYIFRTLLVTEPERRGAVLAALRTGYEVTAVLADAPPISALPPMPAGAARRFRMALDPGPPSGPPSDSSGRRPFMHGGAPPEIVAYGGPQAHRLVLGVRLPEGQWLHFRADLGPSRPWHSPTFMAAFALMTVVAAGLTWWAVRRLTAPVRVLADAAEALGRDVRAPPLPETGPEEVATAAAAFNTMANRIRRFVDDRTQLLIAIGHDLRTPITRLKLRAEFMDDDDLRGKMLADLEELEAMVAATLAFGRDAGRSEPVVSLDLPTLMRTILDEAGDTHPDMVERISYDGPVNLTIRARFLGLKRALTNLVSNALLYGGSVHARVGDPAGARGMVTVMIEDDGPGIPPAELERVFEPFHRLETSRNRETGGTGLGLPITRDIMRAHGGDVVLENRVTGGTRAVVTLPI